MRQSVICLLTFSAMSFATGPAQAQHSEEAPSIEELATRDAPRCVTVRNINGYSVIDDRHMVLRASARRYYLVTTRSRCSSMGNGFQIATTFGDHQRICRPFLEYIIADHGWRCAIDTIEEVDSREQAREIVAYRLELQDQQDDAPARTDAEN